MTRKQAIEVLDMVEAHGIADEAKKMAIQALEEELCEDWYDIPSNEMNLEQARQAVRDLRKKLVDYLWQEPCKKKVSMDNKQAFNYINEWLKDEYSLTGQDREALYHALDALSLLIPKQPVRIGTAVSYKVKECPHCHKVVFNFEWTDDTNNMYYSRFKNWFNGCPGCGQRFTPITCNVGKWKSEEEGEKNNV